MRSRQKKKNIKVVILGDCVGKTCFLFRSAFGVFPLEVKGTKHVTKLPLKKEFKGNEHVLNMEVRNSIVFDNSMENSRFRAEGYRDYKGTKVFILMFDWMNKKSLENVVSKWYREIYGYYSSPIILVATKCDLLENWKLRKENKMCTKKDIISTIKKINAKNFFSVSSLSKMNVNKVIDEICNLSDCVVQNKGVVDFLFGWISQEPEKFCNGINLDGKFEMTKKAIEEMKKHNENEKKKAMISFKKQRYNMLPFDVIKLILNEFVLIDFKTMTEFKMESAICLNKFGLNQRNACYQFFGYFKVEKEKKNRVFQLFYCFLLFRDWHVNHLPRLLKEYRILVDYTRRVFHKTVRYVNPYDGKFNLEVIERKDLKFFNLLKVSQIESLKTFSFYSRGELSNKLINSVDKKFSLLKKLEKLGLDTLIHNAIWNNISKMNTLKHLLLKGTSFSNKMNFSEMVLLETLIIVSYQVNGKMTGKQASEIISLPKLKKIRFSRIGFDEKDSIRKFFDKKSIEIIMLGLKEVEHVKEVEFKQNSHLKIVVIEEVYKSSLRGKKESEKILLEFSEKIKNFPKIKCCVKDSNSKVLYKNGIEEEDYEKLIKF